MPKVQHRPAYFLPLEGPVWNGGVNVSEAQQLKDLSEENKKLKSLVSDLPLDKVMLQEVLSKKV